MLPIRAAVLSDQKKILELYKKVSKNIGGIARDETEITALYVNNIIKKSKKDGIQLVIENPEDKRKLIAEIHCYKLEPKVFKHVLSELTIVVDKDFQGRGFGKIIFKNLLDIVSSERDDILRVELIARESNLNAVQFYEKLGFKVEGRFEKRDTLQ